MLPRGGKSPEFEPPGVFFSLLGGMRDWRVMDGSSLGHLRQRAPSAYTHGVAKQTTNAKKQTINNIKNRRRSNQDASTRYKTLLSVLVGSSNDLLTAPGRAGQQMRNNQHSNTKTRNIRESKKWGACRGNKVGEGTERNSVSWNEFLLGREELPQSRRRFRSLLSARDRRSE